MKAQREWIFSRSHERLAGGRRAIARARLCISDDPKDISYNHFAVGSGLDSFCLWFNPTQSANPIDR
jgi:hypothetical protein